MTESLRTVRTLVRVGVVRPSLPHRGLRALLVRRARGNTVGASYMAQAILNPDRTAIADHLGELTFRDVDRRTNALANALRASGAGPGDRIAVLCRNHRHFVEATVACSKLGADQLLLNSELAAPQMTALLDRERPAVLVYDEEFRDRIGARSELTSIVALPEPDAGTREHLTIEELVALYDGSKPPPAPDAPGRTILLTSGTTGTPKGAVRGAPGSLRPGIAILNVIPVRAREKHFIVAPLFHNWGYSWLMLTSLLGATVVLRRRFDAEDTLRTIDRERPQAAPMVPVMAQRILELEASSSGHYGCSSLRAVPLSGSALPGDLAVRFMDRFGDVVYNLYGSTEVALATVATPADLRAAPGTAGRPPHGSVVRILDAQGRELPHGETGRIFVGNEALFAGYTAGVAGKEMAGGLMSTGDVGHVDEAGRLFVSGRSDDMIVSGGENVFPREVEDLLARHEAVAEAAVIGVEDEQFGQRLRAFVVLREGAGLSEDAVKGYVKANLPRYSVPRDVVFLDALPRSGTGKVVKRDLERLVSSGTASTSSPSPSSPSPGEAHASP